MNKPIENLIALQLKALRSDIAELRGDLRGLRARVAALEQQGALSAAGAAALRGDLAGVQRCIDAAACAGLQCLDTAGAV